MKTHKRVLIKIGEIFGYATIAVGFTMTICILQYLITNTFE